MFEYVLGERTVFPYDYSDLTGQHQSSNEIIYYKGRLTLGMDVSFVCFDSCESAAKVFFCSSRVSHPRVLRALFFTHDASINKHLVCFNRFDGFLPQADPNFLTRLNNPNSSHTVPGNPNDIVQREIRELSIAFKCMHAAGVSSSWLHLLAGYVWSAETRGLMIIMVDERREDHCSTQWNKMLAHDIKLFGIGLDKYFLKTTGVWAEKDSFMRCFSIKVEKEDRRLSMISTHPFLENDLDKILQIFASVHHAWRSHHNGRLQLTKLMAALNRKEFNSEFMPDGVWTRQEMSPQFVDFLRGKRQHSTVQTRSGNSILYNTKDMQELLRCLRNMFHNASDLGDEVRRYWPHLTDRFHEKLAG